MAWAENHIPKNRKHRASGQALVAIDGVGHYLGPHKSKASVALYDRLVAEYLAAGRQRTPLQSEGKGVVVVQVLAAYWKHCKAYYRKDGKPTQEQAAFRTVIGSNEVLYIACRDLQGMRLPLVHGHRIEVIRYA